MVCQSYYTISLRDYGTTLLITDPETGETRPPQTIAEMVDALSNDLFDFDYAWYVKSETQKQQWRRLFVIKYLDREIGFETMEFFKLKLYGRFMVKLPYYQQLSDKLGLMGDIFLTIDETGTLDRSDSSSNTRDETGGYTDSVTDHRFTESSSMDTDKTKTTTDTTDHSTTDIKHSTNDTLQDSGTETGSKNGRTEGSIQHIGTNSTSGQTKTDNTTDSSSTTDRDGTDSTRDVTSTTDNSSNNTQGLTSNNPQISVGTKDYANSLQRNDEILDRDVQTTLTGSKTSASTDATTGKEVLAGNVVTNGGGHDQYTDESTNSNTEDTSREWSGKKIDNSSTIGTDTVDATSTAANNVDGLKTGRYDTTDDGTKDLTHTNNSNVTDSGTSTGTQTTSRRGFNGSKALEYERFAQSLRNLDEMFLDEFNDLFLGVFANPWADTIPTYLV